MANILEDSVILRQAQIPPSVSWPSHSWLLVPNESCNASRKSSRIWMWLYNYNLVCFVTNTCIISKMRVIWICYCSLLIMFMREKDLKSNKIMVGKLCEKKYESQTVCMETFNYYCEYTFVFISLSLNSSVFLHSLCLLISLNYWIGLNQKDT